MSKNNTTLMAEHTGDNTRWSVIQMLETALAELKSGKEGPYPKAVLLLLDDRDGYMPHYFAADMSCSEMIARCRIHEEVMLQEMRFRE